MRLLEQRRYLVIRKASYAATYSSDKESQFRMLTSKLKELVHIGSDGLHTTLHRGDSIALALQANALSPYCSKPAIGNKRCPATMHTT